MAIRMRRGNEADFDPSKMLPGEWAVSTDTKYVRMCFSPGIVLRMATYEAFESDMAEIRNILSECQSIQTAVEFIQQNVTASELVIENYVKEAKQYRDEAEQFRNEAFSTTPEGYEDLVKNVSDNTVKIDTIIEKAELNIKNNARGSNIHLTDSAESNVVALELYGKTEQNAYTGKNLLKRFTDTTLNGVNVSVDENGIVTLNGTPTLSTWIGSTLSSEYYKEGTTLHISGCDYSFDYGYCQVEMTSNGQTHYTDIKKDEEKTITVLPNTTLIRYVIYVKNGMTLSNAKVYPMISFEGGEYEPYVGGSGKPSPSPDYPQEIKSVVLNTIKTRTKNFLDCSKLVETTKNNVTFTPVKDDSGNVLYINVNGTPSVGTTYGIGDFRLEGEFIASDLGGSYLKKSDGTWIKTIGEDERISIPVGSGYFLQAIIFIPANEVCNNRKYYPMISVEGGEYEPYNKSEITLLEPIELNGFNGVYDVVTSDGVTRKIKRRRLLRTDGWSVHSNGWIYTMSITDFKYGDTLIGSIYSPDDAFCTHLVYENNPNKITQEYSQGITMWYDTAYSGYRVAVYLPNMTSEEWLTLLDENKVYLVYELATPTTEELQTDFTALKTFYPETHVSNDADCDMSITYTADAKNYIDNKIALLTTAIYNNI